MVSGGIWTVSGVSGRYLRDVWKVSRTCREVSGTGQVSFWTGIFCKSGQVKLGQFKLGKVESGHVKSSWELIF